MQMVFFLVPDGCEVPSLFLRGGISPPSIPGGGGGGGGGG